MEAFEGKAHTFVGRTIELQRQQTQTTQTGNESQTLMSQILPVARIENV